MTLPAELGGKGVIVRNSMVGNDTELGAVEAEQKLLDGHFAV